jgi:uncharacterized protein VirK/YbjX
MIPVAESGLALLVEELGLLEMIWSSLLCVAAFIAGLWKKARQFVASTTAAGVHLVRIGKVLYPDWTIDHLKCRAKVLALWFTDLDMLRAWFGVRDNPGLTHALSHWPRTHGVLIGPYIHCGWALKQRLSIIDQHYREADRCAALVTTAVTGEVELARFDERYPGLRLVLDKSTWFTREGEVVLNLFVHGNRMMAIAFTLGHEAGLRVAYVGALQGAHSNENFDARQLYRDMTHALHGMRPRDFLVAALKMLCTELRVAKLYAVADDSRQHHHPYFGGTKKSMHFMNYDEVWSENGGTRLDNGFFEIPVAYHHRDLKEISTHKRAAYRRRYQLLDAVGLDIKSACAR